MNKTIAIYGAQLFAGTIYMVLKNLLGLQVSCFIVSDKSGNSDEIDGIVVMSLTEYLVKNGKEKILIATPEEYHMDIADQLKKHGRNNYIFLTSRLRNRLLEEYYRSQEGFITLNELKDSILNNINHKNDDLKIYMARSSKDKSLQDYYEIPEWLIPVQAGASIDDINMQILKDNKGYNISDRNRYYCELTALYWIWKNVQHEYIGICHYRRVFRLQDKDIQYILEVRPDVILPYPTIHFPNIQSQYKRYLTDGEFQLMCDAILMHTPEMMDLWKDIWEDCYFYNYNMMIAKCEILNNYCKWIFDVLEKVDRLYIDRQISPSNRYAGYMGEILTTVFFRYYRTKLRIVHVGVNILL